MPDSGGGFEQSYNAQAIVDNTSMLVLAAHVTQAVESRCGAVVLAQTRLFSAPFVWWCLNCPSMTPFPHPAHRTGRADFPHPALGQGSKLAPVTRSAAPDVDRSSRSYPHSPRPCHFLRRLEPGLLSSTGITRLPRYYKPIRHPARPGLALPSLQWVSPPSDGASRVAAVFLLYVPSPLPRRNDQVRFAL